MLSQPPFIVGERREFFKLQPTLYFDQMEPLCHLSAGTVIGVPLAHSY